MQAIDHEGVAVAMAMAMVSLHQMRIVLCQIIMAVLDLHFVRGPPEPDCTDKTKAGDDGKNDCRQS